MPEFTAPLMVRVAPLFCRLTSARFSEIPLKVGVVILVMPSVDDDPESLALDKAGLEGALGASVSMVIADPVEGIEVLPARSVARALIVWAPSLSAVVATDQLVEAAIPDPDATLPSSSVTVALVSVVPVKVGVVTRVILSLFKRPLSLAAASTGMEGAAGAVVSMTIVLAAEALELLPARSVALTVMAWVPATSVLLLTV